MKLFFWIYYILVLALGVFCYLFAAWYLWDTTAEVFIEGQFFLGVVLSIPALLIVAVGNVCVRDAEKIESRELSEKEDR